MANTTNFGWETPDDTDLVKDGALAMRTLGNAIDTSLVDLKGGTTGQVLSKNTNTDMDFVWTTPNVGDITEVQAGTGISVASGTGPIPVVTNTVATTFDAKGDLVVGTGADTFAKLTVGTNGHTLVADSSTATGLKWAAAATSGFVGVGLYDTADQSLSNGAQTKVTWTSEYFDTDSFHNNSTNTSRITIPSGKGGKYLISAGLTWATNGSNSRRLYITKNGSTTPSFMQAAGAVSTFYTINEVTCIMDLVAGDYIEIEGYQNSGGSLNILKTDPVSSWCFAQYLGA